MVALGAAANVLQQHYADSNALQPRAQFCHAFPLQAQDVLVHVVRAVAAAGIAAAAAALTLSLAFLPPSASSDFARTVAR